MCNLGVCYFNRDRVPESNLLAFVWLSLAAQWGIKEAQIKAAQARVLLAPVDRIHGERQVQDFNRREREMTEKIPLER